MRGRQNVWEKQNQDSKIVKTIYFRVHQSLRHIVFCKALHYIVQVSSRSLFIVNSSRQEETIWDQHQGMFCDQAAIQFPNRQENTILRTHLSPGEKRVLLEFTCLYYNGTVAHGQAVNSVTQQRLNN